MASAEGFILYGVLPLLFVIAVSEAWQRRNHHSREQPTPGSSGQLKEHRLPSGLHDKVSLGSQSLPIAPRLVAADHAHDGKHHLLLACTGSVATIKLPQILSTLTTRHSNLSIKVLLTESARNFLQGQAEEQPSLSSLAALPGVDGIYFDEDEWRDPWTRGAHILHIELRRWADLMVIAPLSANSLAKLANGYSDNLISSVVRAWDTTGLIDGGVRNVSKTARLVSSGGLGRKKIIVAPAMNTAMWNHPVTARHLKVLEEEWGTGNLAEQQGKGWFEVLRPVEKTLACGDTGSGAMREWKEIVAAIELSLGLAGPANGKDTVTEDGKFVMVDEEAVAAVTVS